MTQILVPAFDVAVGPGWTVYGEQTFFGAIDDDCEWHDGEDSYIRHETVTADVLKLKLTKAKDPGVSTGHVIRAVSRVEAPHTVGCDVVVELRQSGALIAQYHLEHDVQIDMDDPDPTLYFLREYELTGTEANSITDYGRLDLWVWVDAEIIINPVRITSVDLVLPSPQ